MNFNTLLISLLFFLHVSFALPVDRAPGAPSGSGPLIDPKFLSAEYLNSVIAKDGKAQEESARKDPVGHAVQFRQQNANGKTREPLFVLQKYLDGYWTIPILTTETSIDITSDLTREITRLVPDRFSAYVQRHNRAGVVVTSDEIKDEVEFFMETRKVDKTVFEALLGLFRPPLPAPVHPQPVWNMQYGKPPFYY